MQVLSVCNSISFQVFFHLPLENTLSIFRTFKIALKLLSVTDADPNSQSSISIITFRQKENSFPRIYIQIEADRICAILPSVGSLSYKESPVSSPQSNLLFQVSVGIDLGSVWLLKHQCNAVHHIDKCRHQDARGFSVPQCRAQKAERQSVIHRVVVDVEWK